MGISIKPFYRLMLMTIMPARQPMLTSLATLPATWLLVWYPD
jgi:hypothetical protein